MVPGLEWNYQLVCLVGLAMIDLQLDGHLILMIDVMSVVKKVIMLTIAIAIVVGEEAGTFRYNYFVF